MNEHYIYHVCKMPEWAEAQITGCYYGSSQDKEDGFIHCSSREQVVMSVAKHRAGQDNLVMLVLDPSRLGQRLKWEPSRSGTLYPHIYEGLPLESVVATYPLRLTASGAHSFPDDF